jgi:hypothetical protein
LVYLAAADGAIRKEERKIIAQFCLQQEGFQSLDALKVEKILKGLYRPTKFEFHKYVREAQVPDTMMQQVWQAAKAIVATNSKSHTEQARAIEYMGKQWKLAMDRLMI